MSATQAPKLYLLNLYPGNVGVTVTGLTPTETLYGTEWVSNGQSVSYVLGQYYYVDISSLISSYNDGVQISAPQANINQYSIDGFPQGVDTVTLVIENGTVSMQFTTPDDVILQNANTDLTQVYQNLLSLISEYASGQPLSQSALSSVSSTLQQINKMLQGAEQSENLASISSEGISALQQVYNNLNQIYNSLTNKTLTVEELQSLQLPSYSTPEASTIASDYTQFLNNAINIMQNASPQGNSSTSSSTSTPTSSTSPTSSQSSTSPTTSTSSSSSVSSSPPPTTSSSSGSTPSSSASSSSSSSTPTSTSATSSASSQSSTSSPTTSPTSSLSSPTIPKGQVLAQIQAGDIGSLLSEASEIPQDMIPLVNTVIQLYQLYGIPDGTPLSTVVERLLSDIRDAYYKISNHKQEEVNTQKISQLLQIYNTLASNGLAPQSQSASKLNELAKTSGIIPALPAVLGQPYPGRVYDNYSNFI